MPVAPSSALTGNAITGQGVGGEAPAIIEITITSGADPGTMYPAVSPA